MSATALNPVSNTTVVNNTNKADSPSSSTEAPVGIDTKALHSSNKTKLDANFKKVNIGDADLSKEARAIMKRYKVGSDKFHNASISTDGKTLVLTHSGKTTLTQNFGGSSSLARGFYRIFGGISRLFGVPHKDPASAKYKEYFNNEDAGSPEQTMIMETLSHLYKGLSKNHYHGVSVFHLDEETGKFKKAPSAISIIDSYGYVLKEHIKNHDLPAQMKEAQAEFENAYALDKSMPLDESAHDFSKTYHEITEGLYAAQGFSFLTVPGKIHQELNVNTDNLNYVELPWHRVQQMADKKWRVMADKNVFEHEAHFNTEDDRNFYNSRIVDMEHSFVTVVRPIDQANKAINPFLGYMENWSQMYAHDTLRTKDKDDKRLVELAQQISQSYIMTYNETLKS